ncbi:MAG: hypothetical protein FWE24_04405 [Defluviitaleaceae bacterium]|nr:hypothetical protein [Defluviitaleaceae bacterium]
MSIKPIAYISLMFLIPTTLLGSLLYLLDIFAPYALLAAFAQIRFLLAQVIIPIYIAFISVHFMGKYKVEGVLPKAMIIILSAAAVIYGYDMMYIAGGFYMTAHLLGIGWDNAAGIWVPVFAGISWLVLAITYICLFVVRKTRTKR